MFLQCIFTIFFNELGDFGGLRGLDKILGALADADPIHAPERA
jgi:hypothetical protein